MGRQTPLRYLQVTNNHGLHFVKVGRLELNGFIDVNWGRIVDDKG